MAVVALTLAAGGLFKLIDPGPTAAMLSALVPRVATGRGGPLARAVGLVEVLVGLWAALMGGVAAFVLAGLFALFAVVMARLVAMGPAASSCGCFGTLSTRPTAVHVITDALAAGVALAAGLTAAPGILGAVSELGGVLGAAFVPLVALGAWGLVAVVTVLPDALDAAGRGGPPSGPIFHLVEARVGAGNRGGGHRGNRRA